MTDKPAESAVEVAQKVWREWTKPIAYPPDYPEVAACTEEIAHNYINALESENESLTKNLAAAEERVLELEWCANELMRHGRDYQRRRAGYADFWSLIWQDVLDAYARLTAEPEGKEPCPVCDGTGRLHDIGVHDDSTDANCPRCNGTGALPAEGKEQK